MKNFVDGILITLIVVGLVGLFADPNLDFHPLQIVFISLMGFSLMLHMIFDSRRRPRL